MLPAAAIRSFPGPSRGHGDEGFAGRRSFSQYPDKAHRQSQPIGRSPGNYQEKERAPSVAETNSVRAVDILTQTALGSRQSGGRSGQLRPPVQCCDPSRRQLQPRRKRVIRLPQPRSQLAESGCEAARGREEPRRQPVRTCTAGGKSALACPSLTHRRSKWRFTASVLPWQLGSRWRPCFCRLSYLRACISFPCSICHCWW